MKKPSPAENLQILEAMLEKWHAFKRHFLKSFTQEPITSEDEKDFLEIKSAVAKNSRALTERLKDLNYSGEKINNILRQSISASQLRTMPIPDRRGLYKEWHSIFIHLSWLRGGLQFMAQGWVPRAISTGPTGTSVRDIKSGASAVAPGKNKSNKGKVIVGIIVLAAIGGAVYYFLNM